MVNLEEIFYLRYNYIDVFHSMNTWMMMKIMREPHAQRVQV